MLRPALALVAWAAALAAQPAAASDASQEPSAQPTYCPVFYPESGPPAGCVDQLPLPFLDDVPTAGTEARDFEVLEDAFAALTTLQEQFFHPELGTWPKAIDWTAAVVGTVLSGSLTTLSQTLGIVDFGGRTDWPAKENLINSLFSQAVGSYFGQDAVAIRNQAYDDILWVVLGWVEAIKFVDTHSYLHYRPSAANASQQDIRDVLQTQLWHGNYWVGAFAHRARIFWELARSGWDTRLCGGGMTWNPKLAPYKNAVTNELWIAASIAMYHHFPGDNITSPWRLDRGRPARDPKYLAAAVEAYKWLMGVNMTNAQGLFVDGYHISNLKSGGTKCDLRDEMVYTYNQGVLLTGQRGLWTATGSASYLADGHGLVQAVIRATGWDLRRGRPADDLSRLPRGRLPPWRGLGRGGLVEEQCDAAGTCSQDSQTFKGIFFHHLLAFCGPLDPLAVDPGTTVDARAFQRVRAAHDAACRGYAGWLRHNARAALQTRDGRTGVFGMWWGAGLFARAGAAAATRDGDGIPHDAPNVTDYRNGGLPDDGVWAGDGGDVLAWMPDGRAKKDKERKETETAMVTKTEMEMEAGTEMEAEAETETSTDSRSFGTKEQHVIDRTSRHAPMGGAGVPGTERRQASSSGGDPNDRGHGRTVETQTGGLALLRALWGIAYADRLP